MKPFFSVCTVALLSLSAAAGRAQPAPVVTAPSAATGLDDAAWRSRYDALLRVGVRGDGVDYAALRTRLPELRALHDWLASNGPSRTPAVYPSRDARLAYWINAYNLTVLRGVAEAPLSMRNVMTAAPDSGFFRARRWQVDGRTLTLDTIENTLVRPVFHDARVHVALNCAARGCPPLRGRAYQPAGLGGQLDAQARRWVASGRAVALDADARRLNVSQLLEWFADDFAAGVPGRAEGPVRGALRFVHAFADEALRQRVEAACGPAWAQCAVTYTPYDWTLNDPR